MCIKIKKFFLIISLVLVSCSMSQLSILNTHCDGTVQHPCIVQDTSYNTFEVRNWRDSFMLSESYDGNNIGLKELWISGSAAPSENGFRTIKENILRATDRKVEKIIDIDLREEPHGYLNGDSIELNSFDNWFNKGKSEDVVINEENFWLDKLKEYNVISNILTNPQFKAGNYLNGKTYLVTSIDNEKAIVEAEGFEYVRFTVTDHIKPDHETVERFVEFVKNLPENTWLHFHCRAGKGRTTTFMVMYDIIKNADKVSFEDIIARQVSVPPSVDLSKSKKQNIERRAFAEQRYLFLKEFYNSIKEKKN